MNNVLLDASALLALLHNEPGAEMVEQYLPHATMLSVNLSETATILYRHQMPKQEVESLLLATIKDIIPFDASLALTCAALEQTTKPYGLSLGDRACLACAKHHKQTVLTADKQWQKLDIDIDITLIR